MGISVADERERQKRIAIVLATGMNIEDHREWFLKYKSLCGNARKRGATCLLTFRQYLKLASRAGLSSPDQIGRAFDKYQMGRKGDTGDYVWGACRFITMEQNCKEKVENGGSRAGSEKASKSYRKSSTVYTKRKNSEVKPNTLQRPCVFISPTGKKYKGPSLNNLCRRFNLDPGRMCRVLNGKSVHHREWTGYYAEEQ